MIGSTNALGGVPYNYVTKSYTLTLPASAWTGSGPYTLTLTDANVRSTDCPLPLLDVSEAETVQEEKELRKSFSYLSYYDSEDGSITFTAKFKRPVKDLKIIMKGI